MKSSVLFFWFAKFLTYDYATFIQRNLKHLPLRVVVRPGNCGGPSAPCTHARDGGLMQRRDNCRARGVPQPLQNCGSQTTPFLSPNRVTTSVLMPPWASGKTSGRLLRALGLRVLGNQQEAPRRGCLSQGPPFSGSLRVLRRACWQSLPVRALPIVSSVV